MLKQRIISSLFIVPVLVFGFLADRIWFSVMLGALTLVGIWEIVSVTKGKYYDWEMAQILFFVYAPAIYVAFSLLLAARRLRWIDNGWWLVLSLAGTVAYDTTAYFVGRSVGRRKITPKISPNKTWEGTIGGFFGSVATALLIGQNFLSLEIALSLIAGIAIGFLAFFGDLLVSWYKRKLGVKDMGKLIPGHGGLLDRIDSHMLVFYGLFFFQMVS